MRQRLLRPEWMDQPGLDLHLHHDALKGLERVNALSLIHRTFWPAIRRLARDNPGRELRLLDVACGGGDILVRLFQTAQRDGIRLSVSGCDISSTAIDFAGERTNRANVPCHLFQFDVLRDEWPTDFDIIVNSLFLHHLTTESAIHVLGKMASSSRSLLLVNDLVRCRRGYLLAQYGGRLLSRSPVVHADGPMSVEAAFTTSELKEMSSQAGLVGATISRCWPARMLLQWNKT